MNPKQKHCRCKNFFASERAVSTTLGFVIITGILVSAFAILMAVQVPQWTKETEAEHAAKVPLSFAELDSVIDMAILRDDSSTSGCRLEMMPESVPVVGVYASAGTLEFNNSAEKFCFMACAPGDIAPEDNITHCWNSTPSNFSDANYTKCHVAAQDYGAELALELGEDMIFDSGGLVEKSGSFQCNKFDVTGSTTLLTSNLIIYAREITIESGSKINADGRGSAGGIQDHPGKGGGPGGNNVENNSAGGGGAGHGGAGGAGGANWTDGAGGAGGIKYESPTDDKTALAGSGGGGGSTGEFGGASQIIAGEGGNGGGYIFLHAPIINIAGDLYVKGSGGGNGGNSGFSAGGGGGGGSGGCILLKGDYVTVSDTSTLYASGGSGGNGGSSGNKPGGGGGGGAGGIIKMFYDSNLIFSPYLYCVDGGDGGNEGKDEGGQKDGVNGENGCVNSTWIPYAPQVRYYATGWLESIPYTNPNKTSLLHYGIMTWNTTTDADTNIIMKVRTSINKSMDENYTMDWDDCPPVVNCTDISDLPSVSDGNQYIQWRAEFITFDLSKTPALQWVNISYEYGIPFIVNTSGNVSYRSQYTDMRNFELVYAQGATIKSQTEGVLMISDPSISINLGKQEAFTFTELKLTAINLTGSNKTLSGGFRATITPSDTNSKLITDGLYYTDFTVNITTEYPEVWAKWFNDTCEDAGLDFGTNPGNYNIIPNGNRVQIAFYGNETRPVKIWLKSAETKIKIENKLL